MVQLYRLQSKRLTLLHRYDAIVTHSDHMLKELIKHGLSPRSAYSFPYYVEGGGTHLPPSESPPASDFSWFGAPESGDDQNKRGAQVKSYVQLIFSGRMEFLKGGHVLIDALPEVQSALGKAVRVVFAGEGRKKRDLERRAERLQRRHKDIEIEFVGWIDRARMDPLLDVSDLLVVPSLWPEPFGLVGPEAGLRGLPVAAFAVGGVPDWLVDGVNGCLAPGDPPTAEGLAEAIVRCLANTDTYADLRRGATRLARQFSIKTHLTILTAVFNRVVSQQRIPIPQPSRLPLN
jgi:glycosyltransferase involved in cell wall biosynthesis